MGDEENEPRSLMSAVEPTPMQKSTLPCEVADPILALTPQKPTKPSHNWARGVGTVERYSPTTEVHHTTRIIVADRKADGIINRLNNTTKQKHQIQACTCTVCPQNKCSHVTNDEWSIPSRNIQGSVSRSNARSTKNVQMCGRIEEPCNFKQPQCHTTAIIGHHLECLQSEQFHGNTAALKALQKSEIVRTAFAGKVAEGVNRPMDERKYSGLIAVDVSAEEIITQAAGEKLIKLRGTPSMKKSCKVCEARVPDILDLFNPDMIVEQPSSVNISSVRQQDVQLEMAPADMAFNLYKHMRCWQST